MFFGRTYVNLTSYIRSSVPSWPLDISITDKIKISFTKGIVLKWPLVIFHLVNIFIKSRRFINQASHEYTELQENLMKDIADTGTLKNPGRKIDHALSVSQKYFTLHVMTDFCFGALQAILKGVHEFSKAPFDINAWDPHYAKLSLIQFHIDLWKLSHKEISMDSFLKSHGNRSYKDWEIAAARFCEYPIELTTLLESLSNKESFEVIFSQQHEEKLRKQEEIKKFFESKKSIFSKLYFSLADRYEQIYEIRENSKNLCFHWIGLFRRIVLQLQSQRDWSDDVYFLTLDELKRSIDEYNLDLVKARQRRQIAQELVEIRLPTLIDTTQLPMEFVTLEPNKNLIAESNTNLTLVCLSPGETEGEVIVINSAYDCKFIESNHIVVTRFVDPQFVPFMIKAKGWILEQGSMLGHSSILARETLIPVVSNYKNATDRFTNGTRIRLNATAGEVKTVVAQTVASKII